MAGCGARRAGLAVGPAAQAAGERAGEGRAAVALVAAGRPRPGLRGRADMLSGGTVQGMFAIAGAAVIT